MTTPLRPIQQKADAIATFRFVSVFTMETLARWTPRTPELEAKILFGRHIWEFAQHADILGQRTAELRAGLHYTRRPVAAYASVLENAAELTQTASRVGVVYDAIVPDLVRRYRAVLAESDPIVDQPSVRLIERILGDLDRLAVERRELLADITLPGAEPVVATLAERLAASIECADYRRPAEARA
jgi:hypothetical protein